MTDSTLNYISAGINLFAIAVVILLGVLLKFAFNRIKAIETAMMQAKVKDPIAADAALVRMLAGSIRREVERERSVSEANVPSVTTEATTTSSATHANIRTLAPRKERRPMSYRQQARDRLIFTIYDKGLFRISNAAMSHMNDPRRVRFSVRNGRVYIVPTSTVTPDTYFVKNQQLGSNRLGKALEAAGFTKGKYELEVDGAGVYTAPDMYVGEVRPWVSTKTG